MTEDLSADRLRKLKLKINAQSGALLFAMTQMLSLMRSKDLIDARDLEIFLSKLDIASAKYSKHAPELSEALADTELNIRNALVTERGAPN